MGNKTSKGQQTREQLEAEINAISEEILKFNKHLLNHRYLRSGFAVVLMALIFTGMLVKPIEIYMWGLVGGLILTLIGSIGWRNKRAEDLNARMNGAKDALKKYERGRRKKK